MEPNELVEAGVLNVIADRQADFYPIEQENGDWIRPGLKNFLFRGGQVGFAVYEGDIPNSIEDYLRVKQFIVAANEGAEGNVDTVLASQFFDGVHARAV